MRVVFFFFYLPETSSKFAPDKLMVGIYTPWKINMEPANHLPNLLFWVPCYIIVESTIALLVFFQP